MTDLTADLLITAYSQGIFPMARSRHARGIEWFSPDPRSILPLDTFRPHRSLRQKVRRGDFEIRHDTAFEQVIRHCARPRRDSPESWINAAIIHAFTELHRCGFAHSIEAWRDDRLVGGLYGVALGAAFFGESMFHVPGPGTDASKVCLVHLVEHLRRRRFLLLDVQINSDHMQRLGAVDIPRHRYLRLLAHAIRHDRDWHDQPADHTLAAANPRR